MAAYQLGAAGSKLLLLADFVVKVG
jgi:hypothetical protein